MILAHLCSRSIPWESEICVSFVLLYSLIATFFFTYVGWLYFYPSNFACFALSLCKKVLCNLLSSTSMNFKRLGSAIFEQDGPTKKDSKEMRKGKWYLYRFEDECSSNQRNTFQAIQIGYWRSMAHRTIYRDNVAAGRKTTWEFYIGQKPLGNRTGWLMYDYQRTHKECQGLNAAQDCSSMCRVFLQEDQSAIIGDQKPPDTEHCSPVSSDNADGVNAESMLLRFLEQEERGSPINASNQSEVGALEQRHDRSSPDLVTSDSAGDLNAFVEKGEYLELEDLYDLESTSSSSDDSSLISSNSDDCFDAEALLRDLENESCRNIKGEGLNSRFSVDSSSKSSHAAIRLSQSAGSNTINNSHSEDDERMLANSSPPYECSPKTSSPVYKSNPSTSVSVSCLRGHPKRTHSGRSESSSSSNGSGSKSVARISKLGKKYCCFGPF